jgi:hypothetical protein
VRRLFVARALRADTVSDSGTPSAPFHPAQKCRGSNGFRLRCQVSALSRQTDAFLTTMWCLAMTHMVKFSPQLTRHARPAPQKVQVPRWRKDECFNGLKTLEATVARLQKEACASTSSAPSPEKTPLQKEQEKLETRRKECAESYAFSVGQRGLLGPSGRRYLLAATMDQHAKPPKKFDGDREAYFREHKNIWRGARRRLPVALPSTRHTPSRATDALFCHAAT